MRSSSSAVAAAFASIALAALHATLACSFTSQGQGGAPATPIEAGLADGSFVIPGGSGSSSGADKGTSSGASSGSGGSSSSSSSGGTQSLAGNWTVTNIGDSTTVTTCQGSSSVKDDGYVRVTDVAGAAYQLGVAIGVASGCTLRATLETSNVLTITANQICTVSGKTITVAANSSFILTGTGSATFTLNGTTSQGCSFKEQDALDAD
jgi:hypothetical protein